MLVLSYINKQNKGITNYIVDIIVEPLIRHNLKHLSILNL